MKKLRVPAAASESTESNPDTGKKPDTAGKMFVAVRDFYIGGVKGKIIKGDQIEVRGSMISIDGERYRVPNINAAIRDGYMVEAEKAAAVLSDPAAQLPPSFVVSRKEVPGKGKIQESLIPIEHDTGGTPFEFTNIPVRGAEKKKETYFDFNKWTGLPAPQKKLLLTELTDSEILGKLFSIEEDTTMKSIIQGRMDDVARMPEPTTRILRR